MIRTIAAALSLVVGTLGATLAPALNAAATTSSKSYVITSSVPSSLSSTLPLLRLHFSAPTKATNLPALQIRPATATKWQQIGARDIQAVVLGTLKPAVLYTISTPTRMRCVIACHFTAVAERHASVATSVTWQEQLLAELNYLPVSFTPTTPQLDRAQPTSGTFTWKYPDLPPSLQSQWVIGAVNVVLHGALMRFQSVNNLPTTGVADASTWNDLLASVTNHTPNPAPYTYVSVSMGSPEVLTLFVGGHVKFKSLVNTGIAGAATAPGTYPVYLRYLSTTMSGTNPDGSHYSDTGVRWVSYFNGGDGLHEFYRSTYGTPQSLGCVEMPWNSAQEVYPFTPIGTLITVHA